MRRPGREQPTVRLWNRVVLAASTGAAGVLVVALAAIPSYAGHAGGANCPHTHVDAAISFCNEGVDGKKKCDEGAKFTCRQTNQELFGDFVPSCVCLRKEDEVPPTLIMRMARATEVGLAFPASLSTLSPTGNTAVACAQLKTAIQDILEDKTTLMSITPYRIYHPRLLERLDYTMNNLSTLAGYSSSYSSSCSSAGVTLPTVPISTALSVLAQIKQAVIDSRARLIE